MSLGFIKYIPLPILNGLVAVATYVCHTFNLSIYRSINANLILVNPTIDAHLRAATAKRILRNQLQNTLSSALCWAHPPEWSIQQITKIHNREVLEAGFANDKGMLIIVPHLGVWEMMNAWVSQYGALTIMYKPVKNPKIDAFMRASRERIDASLVPTDATGVKAIFKTLKDSGFSVLLPDHVPDPSGGVVVPFFGIETMTSTLASKLAAKTGCALVGLSCVKRSDGDGYEMFCDALTDTDLYHKDPEIATSALNRAMEQMIHRHFEQYMWGYRRFKHTPLALNPYLLAPDELHALAIQLKQRTKECHD